MSCQIKRTENENLYTFIILANDANFICEIANLDKFNAISIYFQLAIHGAYSCIFHSRIFHRCDLFLHFPLLYFPPLPLHYARAAFSTSVFSVAPLLNALTLLSQLTVVSCNSKHVYLFLHAKKWLIMYCWMYTNCTHGHV